MASSKTHTASTHLALPKPGWNTASYSGQIVGFLVSQSTTCSLPCMAFQSNLILDNFVRTAVDGVDDGAGGRGSITATACIFVLELGYTDVIYLVCHITETSLLWTALLHSLCFHFLVRLPGWCRSC